MKSLQSIRELTALIKSDPKYSPAKSYQWFRSKIQQLGTINTRTYTNRATFTKILPGFTYLYMYDPKYKDELPYWDKFPLVIPFNKDDKGFIGLNLHYLHPQARLILLHKLNMFAYKTTNNEQRLLLSWRFLKNAARFPQVAPCVKRYLFDHCRSKFLKIPDDDWIVMSQLPTDKFIGAKNTKVWQDSKVSIGY